MTVHVQYTYCFLGNVWLLCHMKYDAGVNICTWIIRVLPQSNYGFLNCTVTKHGSTGLHSKFNINEVNCNSVIKVTCLCCFVCVSWILFSAHLFASSVWFSSLYLKRAGRV